MLELAIIITFVVGIIVILGFFAIERLLGKTIPDISAIAGERAAEAVKILLSHERELITEKMKSNETYLDSKKDRIQELIEGLKKKVEETERDRIIGYQTLKTVIDEHKVITSDLRQSTDHLKNLLSNNQLRGKYGEEAAENLLKLVGFVKGQQYLINTSQDTIATRPDFTILLPDGSKINIDAKFPFQALVRYQEAETKQEKETHLKQFGSDIKTKIKQIATRDYINPEEGTVDFAIMFIPNEMVFSFIYDQYNEIWSEAMQKKVILAGPFSFTAILRMVYQSYKTFKYKEDLYSIISFIRTFEQEFEKFSNSLDMLGSRIESVEKQYREVSMTRTRKLTSVMDKIKGAELDIEPTLKALDEPDESA